MPLYLAISDLTEDESRRLLDNLHDAAGEAIVTGPYKVGDTPPCAGLIGTRSTQPLLRARLWHAAQPRLPLLILCVSQDQAYLRRHLSLMPELNDHTRLLDASRDTTQLRSDILQAVADGSRGQVQSRRPSPDGLIAGNVFASLNQDANSQRPEARGNPSPAMLLPSHHRLLVQSAQLKSQFEVKQAHQAQAHFMATFSQEIRNALQGIVGLLGLLQDEELPATAQQYLAMLGRSVLSLQSLVSDVLDHARLDAGVQTLSLAALDPGELLESVADTVAGTAIGKRLQLRVCSSLDPHKCWIGDSQRLRQILLNLAINACKFTTEGFVSISVEVPLGEPDCLRFEVRDSGPGIPLNLQDRIFANFYQAEELKSGSHGGSGLGLAICWALVELMQGRIGVESEPGCGSRFWFEVPMHPAPTITLQRPDLRGRLFHLQHIESDEASGWTHCLTSCGARAAPSDAHEVFRIGMAHQDGQADCTSVVVQGPTGPPRVLLRPVHRDALLRALSD